METTEELNALLASIEEEVSSETPVYLHLPAVTYDGDIVFGNHVWGIYGSSDGDDVTTFTGTVSLRGLNGNYAEMSGIQFKGNSGIGVNAYCLTLLSKCSFNGWDTAAIANNEAWVNAMDCTFTNNKIALKFNSSMAYGTAPNYRIIHLPEMERRSALRIYLGMKSLISREVLSQKMMWTLIIKQSIRWIRRRQILRLLRSNAL